MATHVFQNIYVPGLITNQNLQFNGASNTVQSTSGSLNLTAANGNIILSNDPTQAYGAATKQYVDNALYNITWKQSAEFTTLTDVAGTYATTPNNGQLTNVDVTSGTLFDLGTHTAASGDRVLLKNQSDAKQNGIYYISTLNGTTSTLTRTPDMNGLYPTDTVGIPSGGNAIFIENGTSNASKGYVLTGGSNLVLNTDNLTFVQFTSFNASHHALSDLTNYDDHPQYMYLNGRSGGQILNGSNTTGQGMTLRANSADTTGTIAITTTTPSTNATTGALTVAGGVGISGDVYTTGNISTIGTITTTNTTDSTSTSTGSIVTVGGVGIAKTLNVGLDINSAGVITSTSSTNATSTSTGAIVASSGGLGIGGDAYIGGVLNATNSTASTSTTTGAVVVTGGVGVGGAIYAGSDVNSGGNVIAASGYVQGGNVQMSSNQIVTTSGDLTIDPVGYVLLTKDPTSALGAVTKQYVDGKKSIALYNIAPQQVYVTDTTPSPMGYFTWYNSAYTNVSNARLIFESVYNGTNPITYEVVGSITGTLLSQTSSSSAINNVAFTTLPANNERITVMVNTDASISPPTAASSMYGTIIQFETQLI